MDGSSGDESGVEPIVIELDPVVADLGTARQLWIPTETESGPEHRIVTVEIPPGVKDGTRIRLPGQGEPSPTGGPPGDLVVRIRVKSFVPGLAPDSWAATPPAGPAGPPAASPPGTPPRRRPRRTTVLLVVVAAVGTVVAATIVLTAGDDSAPPALGPTLASASRPSTTTTSATPTPTGMSPASYQKALSAFDARLGKQFAALRRARRPNAVRKTMSGIQMALSDAKADLGSLDPPVAVQQAHAALLGAVDALATDLAGAESAASEGRVCAGSSATALISRTAGARQVRAAAANVAAASWDRAHKYRVGVFMPREQPDRNRRLDNRTVIRRPTGGLGELTIDNHGGDDTVMSVVRQGGARTPVLVVYVRGGGKATVNGIRDGTYRVFMTGGRDWDPALHVFTRDCTFERFDDTISYTTTANTYTTHTYTLRPLTGGNASTSNVDPDSFPPN